MVTTLTAVKVTIPTIKIMMSMSSPQMMILTKKMSPIQMTKTRLLQQQPQDGMNVWYLHIVKIEPHALSFYRSQNFLCQTKNVLGPVKGQGINFQCQFSMSKMS